MKRSMDFRCTGRIHGRLLDDGRFEVKCHSRSCGARSGVVVLHYFDLGTGQLIETKKFQDAVNRSDLFTNQKEKTA